MKEEKKSPIDSLFYSLFENQSLRCAIAITTETLREAQHRHNLDPMATIALGRALSCTALVGSTLKSEQHYINCTFEGNGPLNRIVTEFIAPSSLRGYVAVPQLNTVIGANDPVPQTVGEALGSSGVLQLKKGNKLGEQPYTGVCQLYSGEIAEDVAQYLLDSEQIPSIIAASVFLNKDGEIEASAGILIQKLGGAEVSEELLKEIESKVANDLHLSNRLLSKETPEEIFQFLSGITAEEAGYSKSPLGFRCFCSRDKMASTLMGLGNEELEAIKRETGKIEIKCHYCSTAHNFELAELHSN